MNKIEELIEKFSHNGIEYKLFGEIALIQRGASPRPISSFITNDVDGVNWIKIGDVKEGSKFITNTNEKITREGAKKSRYIKKGSLILSNSMSFGRPYILDIDGCIHDGWLSISNFEKYYSTEFLYYLLSSRKIQNEFEKKASFGGAVQNLNADIVRNISLPVPPLEVQHEIVHILDDFTLLSAELSAELKARREQFSYYREELISNSNGTKYKLDDVVEIYLGLTHTPKYVENGVKFISAQNTSNDYLDLDNVKYISRQEFDSITDNAKPKKDDVLFTRVGSNLGHPVIVETDEELCIFVSLGFLRVKNKTILSNKYLKHWINTEDFWKQVRKNVHGSAKVNLNTGWLKNFEITIPPIKEQNKIIEIMDKLEVITNDISEGLPAEIEARQKQYEYYRDKLLTFKELVVNEG